MNCITHCPSFTFLAAFLLDDFLLGLPFPFSLLEYTALGLVVTLLTAFASADSITVTLSLVGDHHSVRNELGYITSRVYAPFLFPVYQSIQNSTSSTQALQTSTLSTALYTQQSFASLAGRIRFTAHQRVPAKVIRSRDAQKSLDKLPEMA